MVEAIRPGYLLFQALNEVRWGSVYKLNTKRYRPDYSDSPTANDISWNDFRDSSGVLLKTAVCGSDLELIVVPKSVTWSNRDISIFVGSQTRQVRYFLDLSEKDFIKVFDWHLKVAHQVADSINEGVYFTHGFNPEDTAPDAHSLRSKFHTHLHVPNLAERYRVYNHDLTWFDRLTLIEPYSHVFWDFVIFHSTKYGLTNILQSRPGDGYFSLWFRLNEVNRLTWQGLYQLLLGVYSKYSQVVSIFTDGSVESQTSYQRYVLRELDVRKQGLTKFIKNNQDWLSEKSRVLLDYLVDNIRPAKLRSASNPTCIENSSQLWLAKGLSGVINFVVLPQNNYLRFDFAPRIISISGATKILSLDPTIIVKDTDKASPKEQETMALFEATVVDIAKQTNFSVE